MRMVLQESIVESAEAEMMRVVICRKGLEYS